MTGTPVIITGLVVTMTTALWDFKHIKEVNVIFNTVFHVIQLEGLKQFPIILLLAIRNSYLKFTPIQRQFSKCYVYL